jgi:hypothetical protein
VTGHFSEIPHALTRIGVAVVVLAVLLFSAPAQASRTDPLWVTRGWAGYVVRDTGSSFTQITGRWTQPRVVCNRLGSSVGFWIGLGGARRGSRSLEQVGTSADCSEGGYLTVSAWYQLFPAPPVDVPLEVHAGDTLSATLSVDGWAVSLKLENTTTGESFSTQDWMRWPETDSAEWIAEAPAACFISCTTLPLADFAPVHFTAGSTTAETHAGAIGDDGWQRLRLAIATARGKKAALPSALSGDGFSFTVARLP